ncbi:TetR/AcrR family transcriptional regulator [Halorarum halobium]|uniref:TetR/AcrR family transcriptional regulator n=1 Tax=Halorarum halobium TaxID=3075121 RepID=UPI0028A5B7E6|nr:TetR/AcrR family transcriptional regulator [Halobaculum sp. XH14]
MGTGDTDADTATRIVEAARRALVEHGYDGLSMARVAAEFDGSQSLIHYHFDSREGLLAALLERERDLYIERLEALPDDPERRLERLMDTFVREFEDWAEESGMATRFVELSAAATGSEPIRAALRDMYALIREAFERTIADGVRSGVFEPVDPAEVARLLMAGHDSVGERWVVGEPSEIPRIADALDRYVLTEVRR